MTAFSLRGALREWSSKLPRWQQYALSLLNEHPSLTPEQDDDIYRALLVHYELGSWESDFPGFTLGASLDKRTDIEGKVLIREMRSLRNINALPCGETLPIGENLTIIYGATASGKSGYARVLASATGTPLFRGEILPDVYDDSADPQSAEIVIEDAAGNECVLTCIPPQVCPELRDVAYFDSNVATFYLTQASKLGIGPPVLRLFERLADLMTGPLQDKLSTDIDKYRPDNTFAEGFTSDTAPGAFVRGLSAESDRALLDSLAAFSEDDDKKLALTVARIHELEALDLGKKSATLDGEVRMIRETREAVDTLTAKLSDEALCNVKRIMANLIQKRAAVQRVSVAQFSTDALTTVGSPEWRVFIHAAHTVATEEVNARGRAYPEEEDVCLFCQQPLLEHARQLIARYWAYMADTTEDELKQAEEEAAQLPALYAALTFDCLDEDRAVTQMFATRDPELLTAWRKHLRNLEDRRDYFVALLEEPQVDEPPKWPGLGLTDADALLAGINQEKAELNAEAVNDELVKLTKEKCEFEDRKLLKQLRTGIEDHIRKHQWARRADEVSLLTAPITRKHTELHKLVVTKQYRLRFQEECRALGCDLPVDMSFPGDKGQLMRRLALQAKRDCQPVKVLSEGEQRIVALADCLTELNMNPHSAGIVLDDPVNSLDDRHKEQIAKRLVEEAESRQVVVFTHALVFLHHLKKCAEEAGISFDCHWVGNRAGKPGAISPGQSPVLERDYRTTERAKKYLKDAEASTGSVRVRALQDGFAALRATCEYLISHKLLNGVVTRWEEHIKVQKLRDVPATLTQDLADQAISLHKRASRVISAHSHSDKFAGMPPETNDLHKLIREMECLIAAHRKQGKAGQ